MYDGDMLDRLNSIDRSTTQIRDQLAAQGGGIRQLLRLTPPQGFHAHSYGGGWWWLNWAAVPGAGGYEQDHPDTGVGPTSGTRTTIFAVSNGDQRVIRVRAVDTAGGASAWVRCTLRWDGALNTEVEDDDMPPSPPMFTRVTAGHTSVAAWWDSVDADRWDVELLDESHNVVGIIEQVTERVVVFNELIPDTVYGVRVRAWRGGQVSQWAPLWWITTLPDEQPPDDRPAAPSNLAVHCVTTSGAQVTWDNAPTIDFWTVQITGRDAEQTYDSGKRYSDLQPGSDYTVTVIAYRDGKKSPPATAGFTTDTEEEPPPEAPLPTPRDLEVVAVSPRQVRASWRQDGTVTHWFASASPAVQQRVDARRHGPAVEFTVPEGREVTVEVYAANGWDLSPVARQSATTAREQR